MLPEFGKDTKLKINMEYKTNWSSIKSIKESNSNTLLYSIESEYCSDDPNVEDANRYYIRIQDSVDDFYTFITIKTPPSADQQDFETNYKSNAIET
jgi:hypothetical protein